MRLPSIRTENYWRVLEIKDTSTPSAVKITSLICSRPAPHRSPDLPNQQTEVCTLPAATWEKYFCLGGSPETEGTYESDVFDAHIFSRWGRAETRATGNVELFARSGNVDNPDRNWSSWTKVDLQKDAQLNVPLARFVQWKAVLHAGNPAPKLDSVKLNYLSRNVAPDFDDVTIQPGVRYQSVPKSPGSDISISTSTSGNMPRFVLILRRLHNTIPIPSV